VQPLVEGVDGGERQVGVVHQIDLQHAGQRRENQSAVNGELVQHVQARLGLAKRRNRAHGLTGDLPKGFAFWIVPRHIVTKGARTGDHFERGIGNVVADDVADGDLGASVDLDIADGAVVLSRKVPLERVLGLVEMVVGIEDRKVKLRGHVSTSMRIGSAHLSAR
jgi:hypothetical protein